MLLGLNPQENKMSIKQTAPIPVKDAPNMGLIQAMCQMCRSVASQYYPLCRYSLYVFKNYRVFVLVYICNEAA